MIKNKNLFNDSKDKKLITPPGVLYNSIINKGWIIKYFLLWKISQIIKTGIQSKNKIKKEKYP